VGRDDIQVLLFIPKTQSIKKWLQKLNEKTTKTRALDNWGGLFIVTIVHVATPNPRPYKPAAASVNQSPMILPIFPAESPTTEPTNP